MYIKPLLSQPETRSFIFLIINIFILLVSLCLIEIISIWRLFGLFVYLILVICLCKLIAVGHSYVPPKTIDLTGQTIIITGASSGIGRASAIEFAKLGAKVIVGIRGQSRAQEIAQLLEDEAHLYGNGQIIGYHLDLSNLSSVKQFADQIIAKEDNVNILLNNAGIASSSYSLTSDGLEISFVTNHLGHFYLTKLLLPLLIQSKSRIINVSSIGHCFVSNRINSLLLSSSSYNGRYAYNQSKLSQILHIYQLEELYGEQGIRAYSLHPGLINTGITRDIPKLFQWIYQLILFIIGKSVNQGIQTILFCALSDQPISGQFHADCQQIEPSPLAYNKQLAEESWKISEQIIHEKVLSFEELNK